MSQPALKLVGAEMEQPGATPPAALELAEPSPEAREAQRLADLAASFCLFGLKIAIDEAELAVRPADEATPASQSAPPFAFPTLPARRLHVSGALPAKLIKAVDWVVVVAAAEFAARWGAGAGLLDLSLGQAFAFLLGAAALKAGFWITDAYRISPARIRAERGFGGLALGALGGLAVAALVAPDARAAAALAATLPLAALLLAGIHAALAIWIRAAHKAGAFSETIVVIGATEAAEKLVRRTAKNGDARIVAIAEDRLSRCPTTIDGAPVGGNLDALLAWDGLPHVDRIVITVTQKAEARVREIIQRLRVAPNRVDLLLDYETHSVRGGGVDRIGGAAVACVSGRPRNHARAALKRAQDVIIGGALLALLALPMALIALAIKLDSRGPVLYRQRRHGFNNRIITIYKFRSMRHDPGAAFKQVCGADPRITRVGRVLRASSLDELPQLLNVLRGEMSLVGPRPHAIEMKAADRELNEIVAEYAHRHCVKPGLTGWAQVNGSRGPVESAASLRQRVRLDLEYVAHASLWLDLQILIRTVPVVLGDRKSVR